MQTYNNLPGKKREIIFQAALNEFSENGYQGASINTIIQNIGIAKGSIYQYFGDKKGLFLYIFSSAMELVKNNLRHVRESTKHEPLSTRLEKTLTAGVHFINENPVVYRLYIKILAESSMPFRDEILSSLRQYSFDYIFSLLEDAKNKGELKSSTDLTTVGFIIDAVMDRFLIYRAIEKSDCGLGIFNADNNTINAWVTSIVSVLCNGVTE